jgi:hypothetical protein
LHGWAALQRPLQTPISPALLCNCRAETVPAHRTAVTIAASNVDVIFLFMVISFLDRKIEPLAFYFLNTVALPLGCNKPAYA